jgi:uncharacterized SAM-binding protein YcdF (DUF218 family)
MLGRPLSLLVLAAIVAFGLGIWLFLLRPEDPLPSHADAVVVLAGSPARLPVALDLVGAGFAKTLVVSEDSAANDEERYALCHGAKPKRYTLICRKASPFSTRGEAELIGRLATANRWHSLIVVTSRYHMLRSRLLIDRCTQATLTMRATDGDSWSQKAAAIPLEYIKLARAETLQRDC